MTESASSGSARDRARGGGDVRVRTRDVSAARLRRASRAVEWPVLLAGKAGAALSGNLHLRVEGENSSKVLFSIATAMGLTPSSLGQNEGLVSSGLSGLSA